MNDAIMVPTYTLKSI